MKTLNWILAAVTLTLLPAPDLSAAAKTRIVLVAGATAKVDKLGHHDYLGGCRLLADLLPQSPGVTATLVKEDWPDDETVFENAAAVVFYTDGGGKQAYLKTPERIARVQALADRGVGLVFIHQALDYPANSAEVALGWLGGIYVPGKSGRGHWLTRHDDFPKHPIMRGVTPWEVFDGWLNKLQFTPGMKGVTPLVWSSKEHAGKSAGGAADIVGWAYDRPKGGRSFSFSGLDGHSAWSLPGMRQFVVNGVLWSAGVEIPSTGAPHQADEAKLASFLTPRKSK